MNGTDPISLREFQVIDQHARHNGYADLLRESSTAAWASSPGPAGAGRGRGPGSPPGAPTPLRARPRGR